MPGHRIFTTSFASVYPLHVAKAERKGRTRAEVDEVIRWLTGHDDAGPASAICREVDVETFFAPRRTWVKSSGWMTQITHVPEGGGRRRTRPDDTASG